MHFFQGEHQNVWGSFPEISLANTFAMLIMTICLTVLYEVTYFLIAARNALGTPQQLAWFKIRVF